MQIVEEFATVMQMIVFGALMKATFPIHNGYRSQKHVLEIQAVAQKLENTLLDQFNAKRLKRNWLIS